jgi:hypothetical protein
MHRWENIVGPTTSLAKASLRKRYFRWAQHRKPDMLRMLAMTAALLKISLVQALRA